MRVSTKFWLAFSDVRKIMINTPQKHTQGHCQYLQYLPCASCLIWRNWWNLSSLVVSNFNAYFPPIYPTVLHAPAKLVICDIILVEQNMTFPKKSPKPTVSAQTGLRRSFSMSLQNILFKLIVRSLSHCQGRRSRLTFFKPVLTRIIFLWFFNSHYTMRFGSALIWGISKGPSRGSELQWGN